MAEHHESTSEVAHRVQQVVGAMIAGGEGSPDIRLVAGAMGTSVRTLQRRLRATGSTYADVVQRVRYAAARRMLRSRRRRIGEIAASLGYSDPAHFTRAFQRWTGLTPRDFRCRDRPSCIGDRRPRRA